MHLHRLAAVSANTIVIVSLNTPDLKEKRLESGQQFPGTQKSILRVSLKVYVKQESLSGERL